MALTLQIDVHVLGAPVGPDVSLRLVYKHSGDQQMARICETIMMLVHILIRLSVYCNSLLFSSMCVALVSMATWFEARAFLGFPVSVWTLSVPMTTGQALQQLACVKSVMTQTMIVIADLDRTCNQLHT